MPNHIHAIVDVNPDMARHVPTLDTGFRVLKLDSSNMEDIFYTPDSFEPSLLDGPVDNIKPDRTPDDLLFQVMLDLGIELSASIRNEEFSILRL